MWESLQNKDKNYGGTIIVMKQQSIPIYLYVDSMAAVGTRPECCWHVSKISPYLQMEIRQMLLLCITSGESIDPL